ncbi:MAG: DnaJ domain-containing protein [Cellulomonadaceae bacterium]|jgi:molecular chaperone DnaJ|nr:DnaJ domain-containing protein [Cellulomonadaceae bacterium]
MTGQDWMEKDFYQALGVPKDADDAAIKKAYRKLARQYHPDQNEGDPKAEAKFKEIGEAYAVLSDKEQRGQYDAIRAMAGGGPRFQAGPGGPTGGFEDVFGSMFGGGGGTSTRMPFPSSGGAGGSFEDIMSMFGGGRGGSRFGAPQKGADVAAAYTMSFRDAVRGQTVELTVDGRKVTTKIPGGVADGAKLRIRGKGRPSPQGGDAGDLVLSVHVNKHPVFAMAGRNLTMDLPVTFTEAALGAKIDVPTLSGETVTVKIPAGTASGKKLRVKGHGVPASGKNAAGDLHVTVQVEVPSRLSKKARAALEQFDAELGSASPRETLAAEAAK